MSRLPFFYSSPLKRFFFLVVLLCVLGNLPLYTYNFSTFNCVTHSHIPVERSSLSELLLSTSNLSTCLLYTGRMLIFHQRKTCFSINKLNKKKRRWRVHTPSKRIWSYQGRVFNYIKSIWTTERVSNSTETREQIKHFVVVVLELVSTFWGDVNKRKKDRVRWNEA